MNNKSFMKTMILTVLAAVLLTGCGKSSKQLEQEIQRLQQENAALKAQIAEMAAQKDSVESGLDSWNMEVFAGDREEAVALRFTAVSNSGEAGQNAELLVLLNGEEQARIPCKWEGSVCSAELSLMPADGYGYYLNLTNAVGIQSQTELTTPENPVKPSLTYLKSSLESYANLFVEDWEASGEGLTILSGSVQMQLPLFDQAGMAVSCREATLVLRLNGEDVDSRKVTVTEGEAAGSYGCDLKGISFAIPELEGEEQMDLWLYTSLSNGGSQSVLGGSWFYNGNELDSVVG